MGNLFRQFNILLLYCTCFTRVAVLDLDTGRNSIRLSLYPEKLALIVRNFRVDVPIELSTESVEFGAPLQIVMGP